MNVPAFKIGVVNVIITLIEYICKFNKPVILSTGINDLNSVRKSVKILEDYKIDYSLLHTTNLYPTPHNLVRLGGGKHYLNASRYSPGLSDHTTDNLSSYAISLGASIIERHLLTHG